MENYKALRIIISGGGTGGHIFPAISIASEFKRLQPDSQVLFVGAKGKMEMEKVPAAGFEIIGLPICGLQRKLSLKNLWHNLQVPFKVLYSKAKAKKIIRDFRPDIAIGVGGYASAPLLSAAVKLKIPTLIQEQNGFAGLTNRMLAKDVDKICVAYEGMEKFFPAEKLVLSGNPIRGSIVRADEEMKKAALEHFKLDPGKKHLLVIGGSLGCGTLNRSMMGWIKKGCPGGEDVEVLWQCGKYYEPEVKAFMENHSSEKIHFSAFIDRMDYAYACADLLLSRSGASSISEICMAGKACIFVPSPNVAEDHQTHNAMALVNKGAARIVKDSEAPQVLMEEAMSLIHKPDELADIEKNALAMALPDAAHIIVEQAYKLIK
ncbi:MAG: undecaprenyldiphospho-muramoylpentapeptide beta-N-acetylglucosaminyltransferase [Candidatus Cryptobacteroides sp.]